MNNDLESRIKEDAVLLNVGTYRQQYTFSCGPAALKIVLDYFQREIAEEELMARAQTKKKVGTTPDHLCRAAQGLGYYVFQRTNATIEDIETFLQSGLPVLVVYQSPEQLPYNVVLDEGAHKKWGHYAVVVGANKTHLILSNPEEDCGYTPIHKELFVQRWWDRDMLEKRLFHHWFMVVFPQKIQMVDAQGDNYEIGLAIGTACKQDIHQMRKNVVNDYECHTKKAFGTLINDARTFLPACRKAYPQYVQELQGMAKGAEIDFAELFVLSCTEELDWINGTNQFEKCTTIVARVNGHAVLGHNEDYLAYPSNALYIVRAKQKAKPSFLSVGYMGSLAGSSAGLNSAGVAMAGNSISVNDCRRAVLKNFVGRALLDEQDVGAAAHRIQMTSRAVGGNYSLVSQKKSVFVETTARKYAVVTIEAMPAFHTNHFLAQELRGKETDISESSMIRYERLQKIRNRLKPGDVSSGKIKEMLADHDDYPLSICRHDYEAEERILGASTTLASIILNPAKKQLHIATGNPCGLPYQVYSL